MKGIDSAGNKIAAYGRYMPPRFDEGGDTSPTDFSRFLPTDEEGNIRIPSSVRLGRYLPALTNLMAPAPADVDFSQFMPDSKYERTDFNPMLDRYLRSIEADESNVLNQIRRSGLTGGRKISALMSASAKGDKEKGKAFSYIGGLDARDKAQESRFNLGMDRLKSQLGMREYLTNLQQQETTAQQKAKGIQQFGMGLQRDFFDPITFAATGTPNYNQMGQQRIPYTYNMGGTTSYIDSYYTNILNER